MFSIFESDCHRESLDADVSFESARLRVLAPRNSLRFRCLGKQCSCYCLLGLDMKHACTFILLVLYLN